MSTAKRCSSPPSTNLSSITTYSRKNSAPRNYIRTLLTPSTFSDGEDKDRDQASSAVSTQLLRHSFRSSIRRQQNTPKAIKLVSNRSGPLDNLTARDPNKANSGCCQVSRNKFIDNMVDRPPKSTRSSVTDDWGSHRSSPTKRPMGYIPTRSDLCNSRNNQLTNSFPSQFPLNHFLFNKRISKSGSRFRHVVLALFTIITHYNVTAADDYPYCPGDTSYTAKLPTYSLTGDNVHRVLSLSSPAVPTLVPFPPNITNCLSKCGKPNLCGPIEHRFPNSPYSIWLNKPFNDTFYPVEIANMYSNHFTTDTIGSGNEEMIQEACGLHPGILVPTFSVITKPQEDLYYIRTPLGIFAFKDNTFRYLVHILNGELVIPTFPYSRGYSSIGDYTDALLSHPDWYLVCSRTAFPNQRYSCNGSSYRLYDLTKCTSQEHYQVVDGQRQSFTFTTSPANCVLQFTCPAGTGSGIVDTIYSYLQHTYETFISYYQSIFLTTEHILSSLQTIQEYSLTLSTVFTPSGFVDFIIFSFLFIDKQFSLILEFTKYLVWLIITRDRNTAFFLFFIIQLHRLNTYLQPSSLFTRSI